jgi:hypothetical protein
VELGDAMIRRGACLLCKAYMAWRSDAMRPLWCQLCHRRKRLAATERRDPLVSVAWPRGGENGANVPEPHAAS